MSGPSVLLVGGSSEIGLAIVGELTAGRPGLVVLAGRMNRALSQAAEQQRATGNTVRCREYDADWPAARTRDMLRGAYEITPGLDVIVVAVGSLAPPPGPAALPAGPAAAPPDGIREPELERLLRINLTGPALVANEAAALLTAQGHGQLVVVTSASAVRPRDAVLGYSVAKQALDSFVRGLDRRTRPGGVRCYVVRPGQVRTRMTAGLPDVPLTTGPERVARRVRSGLARRSGVVWSPAAMHAATTLLRLAPGWALPRDLR